MKETKQGALPGTAAQARQLKAWLKENGEKPGAALPALQKAQEIYWPRGPGRSMKPWRRRSADWGWRT